MRCPGCGYVSFDVLETCKHCGAPMGATSALGFAAPSAPAAGRGGAPDGEFPEDLRLLQLEPDPTEPVGAAGDPGPRADVRRAPEDRGRASRASRRTAAVQPAPAAQLEFGVREPPETQRRDPPGKPGVEHTGGADPEFRIAEDLFGPAVRAVASDTSGAPFSLAGVETGTPLRHEVDADWHTGLRLEAEPAHAGAGPIIDRDDEVPERFWVPEVAGLGRRAAALLVDQLLLAALLALFVLGAWVALRLSGLDGGALFTGPGFLAALPAFALLALLHSAVYHTYFHGRAGSTPGKALAGVGVCTGDGAVPSRARAALRWLAAVLGLGCAGVGVAWALFEPRRRGWADLLSSTVVAERRALRGASAQR